MQKITLAVAISLGLLIAYIDSRPTWDDAGITLGALLLGGFIIGLMIQRHPWLYALAFGIWIPLWNLIQTHCFNLLPVLLFPFVSVYSGWALRKLYLKTLKPEPH